MFYTEEFKYTDKENNLKRISDPNNLFQAFYQARKGTGWKGSVIRFEESLLWNISDMQKDIDSWKYHEKPMNTFELNERGHIRLIKSHHIRDRVIQRSFCDNVLMREVLPKLIYDNGASVKNKGISFARRRFEIDMRNAYREWGKNAYILQIDFSKFFDNIMHQKLVEMFGGLIQEEEIRFFIDRLKEYEVDVSYMTDAEFAECYNTVFNSLEYQNIPDNLKTGEKMMKKSVGIGSQMSQVSGIYYPHQIDTFCKYVMSLKHYGRYMDDSYIILDSKEELKKILKELNKKCEELGLTINMKKTHIRKLSDNIVFLKTRYSFDKKSHKLIRKMVRETFTRERRRLRKFQHLMEIDKMKKGQILNCYLGWRGTYKKFDSGYQILKMDEYFRELFNVSREELKNGKLNPVTNPGKGTGNKKPDIGTRVAGIQNRGLEGVQVLRVCTNRGGSSVQCGRLAYKKTGSAGRYQQTPEGDRRTRKAAS